MQSHQPFLMRQRLDQHGDRRRTQPGERAADLLSNGLDLVLKQRHERRDRLRIADAAQRLGRVHADDPIGARQGGNQLIRDAGISDGGQNRSGGLLDG